MDRSAVVPGDGPEGVAKRLYAGIGGILKKGTPMKSSGMNLIRDIMMFKAPLATIMTDIAVTMPGLCLPDLSAI